MTISKKLLLIATIGLSMPFNAFSNFNEPFFASNQQAIIASYMPMLYNQTTADIDTDKNKAIDRRTAVEWLDKELRNQSLNKYDADAIVYILQSNTTIDSKIANILEIKWNIQANEEAKKAAQAKAASRSNRGELARAVFACGAFILFGAIILIDAVTNPYRPKRVDSITYNYNDGSIRTVIPAHHCSRHDLFYNSTGHCYNPRPIVKVNVIPRYHGYWIS